MRPLFLSRALIMAADQNVRLVLAAKSLITSIEDNPFGLIEVLQLARHNTLGNQVPLPSALGH